MLLNFTLSDVVKLSDISDALILTCLHTAS